MRYEIRRKSYPFTDAPAYDGVTQGYEALACDASGRASPVSRHGRALDAAIAAAAEAHRLNRGGSQGTSAWVRGFWSGPRPPGVMKNPMPVSYRVREDRS